MRVLDYDKVLAQCAFLACDVLELQFKSGMSRSTAVSHILASLGYRIEHFKLGPWFATSLQPLSIQSEMDFYRNRIDYDRASKVDSDSRTVVVGANIHLCELATIAIALDRDADVWLEEPKLHNTYSPQMLDGASAIVTAIYAYVEQWLWFGDVPQYAPYWKFPLRIPSGRDGGWENAFSDWPELAEEAA